MEKSKIFEQVIEFRGKSVKEDEVGTWLWKLEGWKSRKTEEDGGRSLGSSADLWWDDWFVYVVWDFKFEPG